MFRTMAFNFEEELKKLPGKPGVYLMHDEADVVIYVGKAISLRNRVRQYFRPGADGRPKIERMMPHVSRFEYIVTDSELEALVLENNLIKEYSPKYNTMLKDGKTYPYIRVTVQEDFPRLQFARQMKRDKSKYFGPYTSSKAVKDTMLLLQKLYCIRSCSRRLPQDIGKDRPCLNYHIHQCKGPCQGYIGKEEYKENVSKVLDFLNGKYQPILEELKTKMELSAENMEFEEAAQYRDLLRSVSSIAQKQKATMTDQENRDIIAFAKDQDEAVVQVFFVRNGQIIGREHFYLKLSMEKTSGEILKRFLFQFYSGTPFLPKELVLQSEPDDMDGIEQWLTQKQGHRVYIKVPKAGEKEKLVELARKNARMVLDQDKERIIREENRTRGALNQIAKLLGFQKLNRVEAFDISNLNGFLSVGSMVVFEDGKPKKNDYRKFKLKTVSGPDDYASMYEVLTRRFKRGKEEQKQKTEGLLGEETGGFSSFPDLIMMDGGKGQVNVALKVLEELNLPIPVCGMVKDDHHRTRGLYYNGIELDIDTRSEGFRLITRIQDEAHRFAITFHRSLRGKEQIHSALDDIHGIGPKRRKALMKYFESFEEIRKSSVEDLMRVPELNQQAAESVYNHFHIEEQ